MKPHILIILILTFSVVGFGQKSVNPNLKTSINQYAAKSVLSLNKTAGMGKYRVSNKNIFYSDIDNDGDLDAIVEIVFCEYSSCHPTTQSSKVIIFLNQNNKYSPVANKQFSLFGKINSITNNKIHIDIYGLDEGEPQCCPSLKKKETYILKGNSLIKVKN